jgi:SAM-dependent methyltransferase
MKPFVFVKEMVELEGLFTVLLMQDKFLESARILKQFLKKYPGSAEVYSMKGRLLRVHDRVAEGDALIWKAIEQRAEEISVYYPEADVQSRMMMFSTVLFLGGNADMFVQMGKFQVQTLLEHGLEPHHKVLDVGCGCFRAGYFLISFLNDNNYYGIEPYKLRVDFGLNHVLGDEERAKNPTIGLHTDFSFSTFDTQFDFVLARSVWTHASRNQILVMMDEFKSTTTPEGVFLTSYVPADSQENSYKESEWLGRSEQSEQGGYAFHSLDWITEVSAKRGLRVEALTTNIVKGQVWLKITHQS